ncbi:MAG: hypothetical protein WAV10_02140 [Minisyncoccia bacterium]
MNKIWFKRKRYGWGWYPSSWQGWLVLFVWFILFTSLVTKMDNEWLKKFIFVTLMTGILIFICYKKGEKPKWQWGKRYK